jgi:hypothetical protein
MTERRYRAGDSVEDICRACKLDRMHTVVVADAEGRPIRDPAEAAKRRRRAATP